jgi:hypothetical protein
MSTSAQMTGNPIRAAMTKANDLFNTQVFGERNFDALDNIYTTNASILPPGAPMISGRQAIKELGRLRCRDGGEIRSVLARRRRSVEMAPRHLESKLLITSQPN